jgi:hypothetical protein
VAPRILHFGHDDCNRIALLRAAGYVVDECDSVPGLLSALSDGSKPDAIVIAEPMGDSAVAIVSLVREHSSAALILFQGSWSGSGESGFDLVIRPQTDPALWLEDINKLIQRG